MTPILVKEFPMNLHKLFLSVLLTLGMLHSAAAAFDKTASSKPVLLQKGAQKEWCPVCGMKIESFYKTSHAATLPNGEKRQYCSIRCLAVDMQEYSIDLATVEAVDAHSEKIIKAQEAFYVLGSEVPGTMSKTSKLAFEKKSDAEAFSKEHGGTLATFEEALAHAKDSLKSDIAMVQTKKEKKVYPMGKNIFEKKCSKNIDLGAFIEIHQLKAALQNDKLCGELQEHQLHPLALYLWEVKRFEDLKTLGNVIDVSKEEKCPVCGMFVYKYPRWAAQVFFGETHYSFDGVKDMMKFYFEPQKFVKQHAKEKISKILVTDYYTQKAIEARDAYFVTGSDVYGPMGHELIPFASKEDAKTFYMDHKGGKILQFDEITKEDVYKLDE